MVNSSEFVLIIIKTDTEERGLELEIQSGLEHLDLNISKIGTIQFDLKLILEFYEWPKLDDPELMRDYMCTKPLSVWFAHGDNALSKAMTLKNQLRLKYCYDGSLKNLFHCSGSQEELQQQYNLLERYMNMKPIKKRTGNQVEVIVFRRSATGEFSFLMLKRAPERGGFWQPVTGNVEEGESFERAALREVQEELGITDIIELIDTEYSYEFTDNGIDQFEKIFGAQVSIDQTIKLSSEHTEYYWASQDEALNVYLKYPGNKEGLRQLYKKVTKC